MIAALVSGRCKKEKLEHEKKKCMLQFNYGFSVKVIYIFIPHEHHSTLTIVVKL